MSARNNTTTNDAPKLYTVGEMALAVASAKGIDHTKAAKLVRSKLRANFAAIASIDQNVAQAKSAANDGNRWPAMSEAVHAFVTTGAKLPTAE